MRAACDWSSLPVHAQRRNFTAAVATCGRAFRRAALLLALLLTPSLARAARARTCGRGDLSRGLAEDHAAWVRRASPEARYTHCKVLSARYNCTRFATSAADYRVGWKKAAAVECNMPNWATVLAALQRAPRRIMLLGDSHTQQVYQAALCMFQEQARNVVAYTACEGDGKHQDMRRVYPSMDEMPECHTVRTADFARFHLDVVAGADGTCRCSLNHAPTTPSCFDVPLGDDSGTFSRVCSAYVRPLEGAAAVKVGLSTGLASLNMTLADFDVLAVNPYISAKDLGAFLAARAFAGRVVTFPKFEFGSQTGVVLTAPVLKVPISSGAEARYRVAKFCVAIRDAWGDAAGECTTVQFGRLMLQRNDDSKASIYPMSYVDPATGETRVCHADQHEALAHPERCNHEGVYACDTTPCAPESHFCMPGPPDDFALLVLAAAL